jgi:hypothetical protein
VAVKETALDSEFRIEISKTAGLSSTTIQGPPISYDGTFVAIHIEVVTEEPVITPTSSTRATYVQNTSIVCTVGYFDGGVFKTTSLSVPDAFVSRNVGLPLDISNSLNTAPTYFNSGGGLVAGIATTFDKTADEFMLLFQRNRSGYVPPAYC